MKDIMLKIVGTQNVDNDTDTIEFMTEGRIYQKGDATYIVYEESKFSGLEGCKTTVKVSGDKVKMFRFSVASMASRRVFCCCRKPGLLPGVGSAHRPHSST